jgi:hypothetical protein
VHGVVVGLADEGEVRQVARPGGVRVEMVAAANDKLTL